MDQIKYLHIVSLTIPYPPDYGGVIDIWYKIKALHKAGIRIILHCFEYNRNPQIEMENYCSKVFYYPRNKSFLKLFSKEPFIVNTRKSNQLLKNLQQDQYPVLIEGIHSVWLTEKLKNPDKRLWLRTHNVESDYFGSLFKAETSLWKKAYFFLEMMKLKHYEKRRFALNGLFCIAPADKAFFNTYHQNCHLITPFHGHQEVTSKPGKGNFLLYHADLSVAENRQNALFVAELSPKLPQPLVIAGRTPDNALTDELSKYRNVEIRENLSGNEMKHLIENASIILLPARQTTGFRLKLLSSLYTGRHIVASPQMVENTGLENLCHTASSKSQWIDIINNLVVRPFSNSKKQRREEALHRFSDTSNAQQMISKIFGTE